MKKKASSAGTYETSWLRVAVRLVLAFAVLGLILFYPAGTVLWPEAWIFMLIYFSWAVWMFAWLKGHNPNLLKKRLALKMPAQWWDKLINFGVGILFFVIMWVAGADFNNGTGGVPLPLEAVGFMAMLFSLWAIFQVMKENAYLSRLVEIQKKSHQHVITTGPYAVVRHPMYAAFISMTVGIALGLGSYYALIPAFGVAIGLVARTYFEDKMLHKELKGYKEYAKKTRFRLCPGLW